MSLGAWALLAVLGGVGAVARLIIGSLVVKRFPGHDLPLGTLFVNLTGAALLGLLVGSSLGGTALYIVSVGLLGSYSTFSSWMVEAALETEWGRRRLAIAYLTFSLLAGFAAVVAGRELAQLF